MGPRTRRGPTHGQTTCLARICRGDRDVTLLQHLRPEAREDDGSCGIADHDRDRVLEPAPAALVDDRDLEGVAALAVPGSRFRSASPSCPAPVTDATSPVKLKRWPRMRSKLTCSFESVKTTWPFPSVLKRPWPETWGADCKAIRPTRFDRDFGERHGTVRATSDVKRQRVSWRGELGDLTVRRDSADQLGPAGPAVYQSAPSGPAAMPTGMLPGVGTGYVVRLPPVVIRLMLCVPRSVNHSAPSGPAAIMNGSLAGSGIAHW